MSHEDMGHMGHMDHGFLFGNSGKEETNCRETNGRIGTGSKSSISAATGSMKGSHINGGRAGKEKAPRPGFPAM
jgi:hypothetical protein